MWPFAFPRTAPVHNHVLVQVLGDSASMSVDAGDSGLLINGAAVPLAA
jgi:hypothetical protein